MILCSVDHSYPGAHVALGLQVRHTWKHAKLAKPALSYASSPHLPSGCHCHWEVWVMTHLNDWNVLVLLLLSVLFKNPSKSVATRVACMNAHQGTVTFMIKTILGSKHVAPSLLHNLATGSFLGLLSCIFYPSDLLCAPETYKQGGFLFICFRSSPAA